MHFKMQQNYVFRVQNANELAVVPKDFHYTKNYVKRQR